MREALDRLLGSRLNLLCRAACASLCRPAQIDSELGTTSKCVQPFQVFQDPFLNLVSSRMTDFFTDRSLKRVSDRVVVISVVVAQTDRRVVARLRTVERLVRDWTKNNVPMRLN